MAAGQASATRREMTIAPMTPCSEVSGRRERVAQPVRAPDPRRDPLRDGLLWVGMGRACPARPSSSVRGRAAPTRAVKPAQAEVPRDRKRRPRRRIGRRGRRTAPLPPRRRRATGCGDRPATAAARTGTATGSTSRSATSSGSSRSMRSPMGRMVDESGTPGRVLVRVASRTIASGRRRTTTTWSAPVAEPSSSTIAPDDRVGRDGARQAGQDPRERLGLAASAGLERERGLAMADGRDAGDDEEAEDRPVERAARRPRTRRTRTTSASRANAPERRAHARRIRAIRRVHAALWGRVGLGHVGIEVWDSNVRSSTRLRGTGGSWPGQYFRTGPSVPASVRRRRPPAAAASWPPSRLTRYSARSAAAIRSVPVRPSAGNVATPMDAAIGTGPRCSPTNGWSRKASRIRSAALPGVVAVGLGQDDRELVAAVAGRDVRAAQRRPDEFRGPGQDPVAEQVAERVVDELEVVEVQHQDAQAAAGRAGRG